MSFVQRAFTPPGSSPGDRGLLAPPPAAPSRASAEVEAARREAIIAAARTRGPAATLLTPSAYGDTGPISVARKVLTGQ